MMNALCLRWRKEAIDLVDIDAADDRIFMLYYYTPDAIMLHSAHSGVILP